MRDISQIDSNLFVQTNLNVDNIQFYDVRSEPFSLFGVFFEDGLYRRIPEEIAKQVSENVHSLHTHTAGGRVKFITDSSYVAIKAVMPSVGKTPHCALTGSAGFDLYTGKKEEYYNAFRPPLDMSNGYESVIHFHSRAQRELTINFPIYSSVSALYIGLESDAVLEKADSYLCKKPIVFYGSSITQGGFASRPGNAYTSVLSRALQMDHINLGFSGSARAEDAIAQYIKSLDMSLFVYDYDHNAPTLDHLKNTHQKMFQTIRQAQPALPILILSRPSYRLTQEEKDRLEIIKSTYNAAIFAGDRNVYFMDGTALMKYAKSDGTVDGCHPNDLGFYSMAKVLFKYLKSVWKRTP